MNKDLMIEKTKLFVKDKLEHEGSGHDWFHIERVYNLAKYIAQKENADSFIVEMSSLLHDIDDWKFSNTNDTKTTVTENFLKSINIDDDSFKKIIKIIQTINIRYLYNLLKIKIIYRNRMYIYISIQILIKWRYIEYEDSIIEKKISI